MELTIVLNLSIAILAALAIALTVRKFLFFVTLVSSYSMYPALKPQGRVLTLRIYDFGKIKRGDILVFYSKEFKQTMIKRVIGLPEDLVEIREDGSVWVNQNKLEESYVQYGGGSAGTYRVPRQEYFLLGDNRAQSRDSRHWKSTTIPAKDITGKVIYNLT